MAILPIYALSFVYLGFTSSVFDVLIQTIFSQLILYTKLIMFIISDKLFALDPK